MEKGEVISQVRQIASTMVTDLPLQTYEELEVVIVTAIADLKHLRTKLDPNKLA